MKSINVKIPKLGINANVKCTALVYLLITSVDDSRAELFFSKVENNARDMIIPPTLLASGAEIDIDVAGEEDEMDIKEETAYLTELEGYLQSKGLI
ncbi:MAG: hypothetical protein VZR28_04820 [Candidatus Cryptobacteroides sp.]|jgi:hypothetical protein|nr:hypothetical protein [Candidatus Cryptobacteroides sp.]MEE3430669.1 hypothetical protein [Candidatus Cryptobacteroides sp.]